MRKIDDYCGVCWDTSGPPPMASESRRLASFNTRLTVIGVV